MGCSYDLLSYYIFSLPPVTLLLRSAETVPCTVMSLLVILMYILTNLANYVAPPLSMLGGRVPGTTVPPHTMQLPLTITVQRALSCAFSAQ